MGYLFWQVWSLQQAVVDIQKPGSDIPASESVISKELDASSNVAALEASLSAVQARVEYLATTSAKVSTTSKAVGQTSSTANVFQQQTLYLGSAETISREWTTTGAEITLKAIDFPQGVTVVFEAGLYAKGGEAWARVINKTTGAVIASTELASSASSTTWKSSPIFYLHPGTNTYAVQVKSSSGDTVYLSGARLVISK